MTAIQTVLVANRGEIAVRVMRTASLWDSKPSPSTQTPMPMPCMCAPPIWQCPRRQHGRRVLLERRRYP